MTLRASIARGLFDMTRPTSYVSRFVGTKYSTEFRVFLEDSNTNKVISPFHDIPMTTASGNFNMVCEIPKWSNGKFEICTSEPMNPIKQDIKKGKLRFVKNLFPHHGYIWNYGAIPQTWEDPNHMDERTKCNGDNDPIDAIEIGQKVAKMGEVKEVKVLGVVALLDEGETDWKIVVIDVTDPLAPELNDVADIQKHLPGLLDATVDWFRYYKVADGKGVNQIAFNGEVKGREFALQVIKETHEAWKALKAGSIPAKTDSYDLSLVDVSTYDQSSFKAEYSKDSCKENPVEDEVYRTFYVDRKSCQ